MKKVHIRYGVASAIAITVIVAIALPYIKTYIKIVEAKEAVRVNAKDSASVIFRNVEGEKRNGYVEVCGEYNAKNGFGAYTGYEGFTWNSDRPSAVFFESSTNSPNQNRRHLHEDIWEQSWAMSPCANSPTDVVKAIRARQMIEFRYQAERGNSKAQYHVANAYLAEKNYVQAYLWYSLTSQGDGLEALSAQYALDSIKDDMTPEQIAKADKLVENWKPK